MTISNPTINVWCPHTILPGKVVESIAINIESLPEIIISFQHLSRSSSHPEAYISISPSFGLMSEMLSKFTQCIISGRDSMLIAILSTT